MNRTFLSIDPAKSTGWAIVKIMPNGEETSLGSYMKDNMYVNIIEYGIIETDTNCSEGQLCKKYKDNIHELIKKNNITDIVIENYFFSYKARQGAMINVYLRTMVYFLCEELGINYEIINVSDWKRYICGTIKPTVDFIKKYGKKNSNKLMVKVSLEDKYNIKFPDKMKSLKTNKMINFRFDIIDAVAICIYRINTLK